MFGKEMEQLRVIVSEFRAIGLGKCDLGFEATNINETALKSS